MNKLTDEHLLVEANVRCSYTVTGLSGNQFVFTEQSLLAFAREIEERANNNILFERQKEQSKFNDLAMVKFDLENENKILRQKLEEKESAASAVPAWQPLLEKVRKINADYDDFDGDRRGIAECLYEAKEKLIEAMLAAAPTEAKSEPTEANNETKEIEDALIFYRPYCMPLPPASTDAKSEPTE